MTGTGPGNEERALLEELAARARGEADRGGAEAGGPPTPEELLDYLAGRLSPQDDARVARRLVADADTARAAVDLADFQAAAEGAATRDEDRLPPDDLATRAGWRELRRSLGESTPRRPRRRPFLTAAAALLVLVCAGLGYRVVTLERQLDRPLANLRSVELVTGGRDAGGAPRIVLEPGTPLLLVLEPAERCATYRARIRGPGGPSTVAGLVRDPRGQLTVLLHGEPGFYTVALSGCEPPRPLQEHRFRVVAPSGAGGG